MQHPDAPTQPLRRSLGALIGGGLAAIASAGLLVLSVAVPPASAHIEIDADGAVTDGYADLQFVVPNETTGTDTVRVEIDLPTSVDIAYVWVRPPTGWRATTERRTLRTPIRSERGDIAEVVSKVTFEGGAIRPGEFEVFDIRLGPLPSDAGDVLTFPTMQAFADGTVERWTEPVEPSEPEPNFPVPTVVVRLADAGSAGTGQNDSEDTVHLVLSVLGIGLGSLGLGLGAVALRRSRKR